MLNKIGLDQEKSKIISDQLKELLANYSIFYQNVRGYHWNIKGKQFFELHLKFEELYNDIFNKIDEIAERILTLGETPIHNYSQYNKLSEIEETNIISNGDEAIKQIVSAFKILLKKQRNIMSLSGEINDEGTNSQMSDYIRSQEKLSWMYHSFLSGH